MPGQMQDVRIRQCVMNNAAVEIIQRHLVDEVGRVPVRGRVRSRYAAPSALKSMLALVATRSRRETCLPPAF